MSTESRSGLAPLLRRAAQALSLSHPELAEELTQAALTESTPIKGLSVPRFLAIVTPLLPTLACPPPALRTKAWFGKVGKMLRQSGLTEELAAELARKVASWSTQEMPVEILITRASQYLSQPDPSGSRRGQPGPSRTAGPLGMWDEGPKERPDE